MWRHCYRKENLRPTAGTSEKFWELEAIGMSAQEKTVREKFLDTVHLNNGRYEVSIPWKEQHALLPDDYVQAVSRLASVLKRLRRNPVLFEEYNRIIFARNNLRCRP